MRNLLRLKAYGDYHDKQSQMLEREVASRTAELRHERDRAQRYLDTAQVILLALDMEGRVTLVNRYACTILGWSTDELTGRDWIETCLPARLRDELRERFKDMVRGAHATFENLVLSRSGEERLIEWRNVLLRDEGGHVIGMFSSGADITDQNQAVEALCMADERTRFALKNANVGIWDITASSSRATATSGCTASSGGDDVQGLPAAIEPGHCRTGASPRGHRTARARVGDGAPRR